MDGGIDWKQDFISGETLQVPVSQATHTQTAHITSRQASKEVEIQHPHSRSTDDAT